MRAWIGWSIVLVAAIHTVFGIVFFGDAFMEAFRAGVFDTVTLASRSAAATAFWFFVAGFLAFMLGGLVRHLERLGLAFPVFLPWSLLALTVVGCVMMPVSAWWLLFVPTVGMFVRPARPKANQHGSGAPAQRDQIPAGPGVQRGNVS